MSDIEFMKLAASLVTPQRSEKSGPSPHTPVLLQNNNPYITKPRASRPTRLKSFLAQKFGLIVNLVMGALVLILVLELKSRFAPGVGHVDPVGPGQAKMGSAVAPAPVEPAPVGAEKTRPVKTSPARQVRALESCTEIAARAPDYKRCGIYAFWSTSGSCEIPQAALYLSTGDIDQDVRGYCASLELKYKDVFHAAMTLQAADARVKQ